MSVVVWIVSALLMKSLLGLIGKGQDQMAMIRDFLEFEQKKNNPSMNPL